jgi:hypothetical protein
MSWSWADEPGAHVDDEHHHVGLGHGLTRSARAISRDDAGSLLGLEAPRCR